MFGSSAKRELQPGKFLACAVDHVVWHWLYKVKVTSVHKLMWGNTNKFFVYRDSLIPDV